MMLWGPPGVGKSQMVAQVAAAPRRADDRHPPVADGAVRPARHPVSRRRPGGVGDPGHAAGCQAPRRRRHPVPRRDHLGAAQRSPPPPTSSSSTAGSATTAVPAGWAIFAAGNRQGDRGVTYAMPAPLANRFSHFEVESHLDDWVAWAYGARHRRAADRLPALPARAAVRLRPGAQSRSPSRRRAPGNSPTARCRSSATRRTCSPAPSQACVGQAAGVEFAAFIWQAWRACPISTPSATDARPRCRTRSTCSTPWPPRW
ncbi:MAG: hypothetical protein MZW92_05650 [Comamonadaceae bacterium]|nr:hypothetical protein [Comamonadaceae bacterium]